MPNKPSDEIRTEPKPLLLGLVEKIDGRVSHNSQYGDGPTYRGQTGPTADQPDYDSD